MNQQMCLDDPRIQAGVADLKQLITDRFPSASFQVFQGLGDDREGINIVAMVDIDDLDEVMDTVIDRLVELQIDEGLPIHVLPENTPERRAADLAAQRLAGHAGTASNL